MSTLVRLSPVSWLPPATDRLFGLYGYRLAFDGQVGFREYLPGFVQKAVELLVARGKMANQQTSDLCIAGNGRGLGSGRVIYLGSPLRIVVHKRCFMVQQIDALQLRNQLGYVARVGAERVRAGRGRRLGDVGGRLQHVTIVVEHILTVFQLFEVRDRNLVGQSVAE